MSSIRDRDLDKKLKSNKSFQKIQQKLFIKMNQYIKLCSKS